MPRKTRKRLTAQEKVAILPLHLPEYTPISGFCDQHGIPISSGSPFVPSPLSQTTSSSGRQE
jgi:hypothetical protein